MKSSNDAMHSGHNGCIEPVEKGSFSAGSGLAVIFHGDILWRLCIG
ncbi:hypothetical protein [Rosistilla ulvae]|nr:hypothetical protein [Rosistilla ulvae]